MDELEALEWSEWFPWSDISSGRLQAPGQLGVYEARHRHQEIRLHIGETNRLKRRVSYLVKGDGPHSAGERIRAKENVGTVQVRWAVTNQHEEIEALLLREHENRFGCLPIHTKRIGRARSGRS